jgi:hypothetical protein
LQKEGLFIVRPAAQYQKPFLKDGSFILILFSIAHIRKKSKLAVCRVRSGWWSLQLQIDGGILAHALNLFPLSLLQ